MRRWLGLMALCALCGFALTGCYTAGICDCARDHRDCYGLMGPHHPLSMQFAPADKMSPAEPMSKVKE